MRVLFDNQCFDMQRWGGISKYHTQLLKTFLKKPEQIEIKVGVVSNRNEYLASLNPLKYKITEKRKIPYERSVSKILYSVFRSSKMVFPRLKNKYYSIDELCSGNFDIFHPTYYDTEFIDYYNGVFVLTLHDFTPELFPDMLKRQNTLIDAKKLLAQRARRVIAISESTKNDAIKILNLNPDKIDVIYHGFETPNDNDIIVKGLPDKYVLFVGNREHYKNFALFLSAMEKIIQKFPDLYVLCTGKAFSTEESIMITTLKLSNRVLCRKFMEEELSFVYRNAKVFVFPSRYEGFGFPVLESFNAGCPTALSDIPVFHEIAGNAAQYFDPKDRESIQYAIEKILSDRILQQQCIDLGKKRLSQYSWEKTAQNTLDCYQRALA